MPEQPGSTGPTRETGAKEEPTPRKVRVGALPLPPPPPSAPPPLHGIASASLPMMEGHDRLSFWEPVNQQLENLMEYAELNARDARRERMLFWLLRIPAILGATAAVMFQALHVEVAVLLCALISAVASAIDAALPVGLLHNVHRMAVNETRAVVTRLQSEWQLIEVESKGDVEQVRPRVAALIRLAQQERERINSYVTAAEASLGKGAHA